MVLDTISWRELVKFDEMMMMMSVGRNFSPLGHIIMSPSQLVFALISECYVLSGETANTIIIVFGLARPGLEPTMTK